MRPMEIIRESWATTTNQPVSAVLVALVAAATCLTTLLTVGRTVASEEQVLSRLEAAGSRILTVQDDSGGALLTPAVVAVTAEIDSAERAFGVVQPFDARASATAGNGNPVPAWGVIGDLGALAELQEGRWPGPGEAIVSTRGTQALGLDGPVGAVEGRDLELPVVGTYVPRDPFMSFDGLLYVPDRAVDASSLWVLATSAAQVRALESTIVGLIGSAEIDNLTIRSATNLAAVQGQIGADLGSAGRTLVAVVLVGGAVLTAIVVFADVLVRRVDLGRRRALGATRSLVVALVLGRTAYAAVAGAMLGTVGGLIVARTALSQDVPLPFAAGSAVLAVLAACVATVAPALAAARRDPLAVIRTP